MNTEFSGTFDRISPAQFAEKIGMPLGWIAVHHSFVPQMENRRTVHGEWFELKAGDCSIYRLLRFSPRLRKGNDTESAQLVIDWAGWLDLCGRAKDVKIPLSITVRRLKWWQRPLAYLKHPDPAIRLSSYLGWGSIALGVLSLILGLLSLYLTLTPKPAL